MNLQALYAWHLLRIALRPNLQIRTSSRYSYLPYLKRLEVQNRVAIRVFVILLFCCAVTLCFGDEEHRDRLVASTPEQLAALTSDPSDLVGGVVSPMDGHLALRERDLVVQGAQPIALTRIYIPPYMPLRFGLYKRCQAEHHQKDLLWHLATTYCGWQFFPHQRLQFDPLREVVRFRERSGATLDYRVADSKTMLMTPLYAVSNLSADGPSGKSDPRNVVISVEKQGEQVVVQSPDGSTLYYSKERIYSAAHHLFLLEKERLPNGRIVRYSYTNEQLSRVESLDPNEHNTYASIDLSGSPWEGRCRFVASTGQGADYSYQCRPVHVKIKERRFLGHHKEEVNGALPPLLTHVSSPFYREERLQYDENCLLNSHLGKDHVVEVAYAGFGERPHYRIEKLSFPGGAVYDMEYQPPVAGESEGWTKVTRSDGASTLYRYSKELLPLSIDSFAPDGELKRRKLFTWDDHRLASVEVRDGEGVLLIGRSYQYDAYGNPVLEVISGDLTGSGAVCATSIRREYSQEGRHLLLREEEESGKVVSMTYLPNTDLIVSRLTKEGSRIVRREFFLYDERHNLVASIVDDGTGQESCDLTGVTERRIKRTTLRQKVPFLDMPEWEEEWYFENGSEKLLRRKRLYYDRYGYIAREEVHDAKNRVAYTLLKEHNARGDLLSESSPLGQRAFYDYTERGDRSYAANFSGRLQTTRSYDQQRRLTEESAVGDNGHERRTQFLYDLRHRPCQKIDSFGNATSYVYDSLVDEATWTQRPPIVDSKGRPCSVETRARFDAMGRKTEEIDANGNKRRYRYNAYGSVAQIDHPNGAKEQFRYERDGRLASHTDCSGLTVLYESDFLGRPLVKRYVAPNGEPVGQESFTYSGFRILSETDREGYCTSYAYDGAGRKIREERAGRIAEFGYDPLGRLATICQGDLVIDYRRDLEGRILEERKSDRMGSLLYRVSYTYDGDGQCNATTRTIDGKPSTWLAVYDPFGRVIEESDAASVTQIAYDEGVLNDLGQRVLEIRTTDALGVVTLERRDALDRLVKREQFGPRGESLSCREWIYDSHGNVILQRDHLYEEGQWQGVQSIGYAYTPMHQLKSVVQALGEREESKTVYTYLRSGQVRAKILPSGERLSYRYDPLGYLSSLTASGGGLVYTFSHNRIGDLVAATDEGQGITVQRQVDPFGNVIQEAISDLPPTLREYDSFDRMTSLKIEGVGEVDYRYDSLYLREVTRRSPDGNRLYSHTYQAYDEDGNLLSEQLIDKLGEVAYQMDRCGQKEAITSPYLSERYCYDEVGNLVERATKAGKRRYSYDGLSQLVSDDSDRYRYDSLYNRRLRNGVRSEINGLNQLVGRGSYDLNGNRLDKGGFALVYDPLNRLVRATAGEREIGFTYDPLGRRLARTLSRGGKRVKEERYLYCGEEEIGALSSGRLKNYKVLGAQGRPIAVEVEGRAFAPLVDLQGSVRRLVETGESAAVCEVDYSPFGEEVWRHEKGVENPWRYAGKRVDPDLGLVHFAKRDYDPESGRWMECDPAGFVDSVNLYQYVFNNPYRYCDPDGEFIFAIPLLAWGAGLVLPSLSTIVAAATYTAVTAAVAYGGYKIGEALNRERWEPYEQKCTLYQKAEDYSGREIDVSDVYAPDRPLPRDKDGNPIPDTDAPHTQLGKRYSDRGYTYPQGREFDKDGQPTWTIDHTDHGRRDHPVPHRHRHEPNITGGTPRRGDPEPLPRRPSW